MKNSGHIYRPSSQQVNGFYHIGLARRSVTSKSLAEVIESCLAQSPHDGQAFYRAVLNGSQKLQILRHMKRRHSGHCSCTEADKSLKGTESFFSKGEETGAQLLFTLANLPKASSVWQFWACPAEWPECKLGSRGGVPLETENSVVNAKGLIKGPCELGKR